MVKGYLKYITIHCKDQMKSQKNSGQLIIDSSKTDEKEKMKAINSIMQYYMMRFEMIKSEPEQFSFNDENCGINIHTPSCCRDRINDLSFTTNKITNNISETIYIEKQKVLLNSTSEPKNQRFALSV